MVATIITEREALERTARSLGLGAAFTIEALLGAALRRAAGILAPCTPGELCRAVWQSLAPIAGADGPKFADVEHTLDQLLVVGDVAEVLFTDEQRGNDRIRLCLVPPAFVALPDNRMLLLGGSDLVGQLLPDELAGRILSHGLQREIVGRDGEPLAGALRALGLLEISIEAWLRLPKMETSKAIVDSYRTRLVPVSTPVAIQGLKVLGAGRHYRQRWADANELSGFFVARRPQAFGYPIWCAVMLENGCVVGLHDLHAPGARWRPCDIAWYLQLALDASRGHPQRYRFTSDPLRPTVDIFAPIPGWAERRLALTGGRVPESGSLARFAMLPARASEARRFLQEYLWLHEEHVQP